MRVLLATLLLLIAPLGGCDELEDLDPRDSSADTSTDTADTSTQPLNASVSVTAMIRSVTANGQVFVEGNFTWSATGEPNLLVAVQIKNAVAYPDWTNLLSDQPPVDIGTAGIDGPDQQFNFRAIAYLAADPTNFVVSTIVTIP
jgi:hypothetical protein